VIKKFEEEFPDDSKFFKPEIMHIHPIETFLTEDDMKEELKGELRDWKSLEQVVIDATPSKLS
jgi:hypothetical protein